MIRKLMKQKRGYVIFAVFSIVLSSVIEYILTVLALNAPTFGKIWDCGMLVLVNTLLFGLGYGVIISIDRVEGEIREIERRLEEGGKEQDS